MKAWLIAITAGLLAIGCQSSSAGESSFYDAEDRDTVSALPTADASPCEAIWKSLSLLSLPCTVETSIQSQKSREPFPPYLQSWFVEKLPSESPDQPVYTPIGQIRYPNSTLWLIESTDIEASYVYALLVDPDCKIHDKLQVAVFKGTMRILNMQRSVFHPDGTITLTEEAHLIDLQVDPPYTETVVKHKRYRIDAQQRRFVAL